MGKIRLNDDVPPPYGGSGGIVWDDGMYNGVREITVISGAHIDSIAVVYDKNGERVNTNKHGGDDGNNNSQVTLMYPDEFLVSVSGTYLKGLIHSLKFKSNIREFGPFGRDVGTTFEFTVEDGGQIVGMKGRSDSYLNAIGVHISRAPKGKLVKEHELDGKLRLTGVVPPLSGGPSGVAWDDGMYSGVREIIVASGVHIDSIRVVYDNDGEHVNANKHGGDDGNNNPKVTLMYPDEFLVSVSGTYLKGLIHSLKFKSNIREFGPFGRDVGTTFEFTVEDGGQIVGMKGRSDSYLNAIGVHISRAPKGKLVKEHELDGKLRLTGVVPPLSGGPSGVAWDDGMYSGVREIIVASGVHIDSIRVVYDNDGERVNANKHGGDDGNNNPKVTLMYPDEFLVSVSGTYLKSLIHSLKFKSNIREFGPFGRDVGTTFEFTVEDGGQIVGMKGRSDSYLNAIGVHISRAPKGKLVKEHELDGKLRHTGVVPPLYGGPSGVAWDDGMYSGVREIIVASGVHIDSIRVVYDNDGERVNANKHGGDDGNNNPKVTLMYPDEFLVSVSGTDLKGIIHSLKFKSNIREFGPFGRDVGTTFEFTVEDGGQIVGMKGRSDSYLNAIGVHISRAPKGKLVKEHELDGKLRLTGVVAPLSGGPSGVAWDDGMYSGVREIIVSSGVHIDSIRVVYDNDGERVNANKHGGDDGNNNPKVTLMYPDEFLVSVSGTYLKGLIHSLKFKSNIREFGPFGRDVGTTFEFTVEDGGQIVGMKGRSDSYLNAIGVHISCAPKGKLVKEHELDGKLRLTGVVPPLNGGPSGVAWDDGMYSGVREIIVASGVHIDSIRVVYDNDGERVNANKHGGDDGNNNPKVTLMYPDEFLVSVSGTYLKSLIHSLKFKSNIREFGPFGRDVGTTFEFTVEDGGQIVGMKGRSDSYLNAIGVHISCAPKGKLVKEHELDGKLRLTGVVPPLSGGPSGVAWDDGMYSGVREIIVASGVHIDSIRVVYDNDGERVNANKHGGDDGNNNPKVTLMYPDEFLVSVSGTYLKGLIHSLKFKSNIREFGPFGRDVGTTFEFTVEDGGQIVGMKGRSDSYLNAIGVHISCAPKGKLVKEHELDGKLRLTGVVPPLSGGPSGVAWDDGMYSGVREIIVASGVHIDSIRVVYDNDGERVNANKHGGDDGNNNPKVTLMYPDEFLVSVSGTYLKGLIHSLKFKSNIRKFGPFGRDVGTTFEFTVEDGGQIVGMKGRSDSYLNAIGVHISRAPKGKLVKEHELDGKLRLTGVVPPLSGGPSGVAWDDGMYSGVREIIVASGVHIDSIRVVYDNDGERVNANKHGGDDGNNNPKVTLMYPDEFLVSVSGTYLKGLIHSLKFKSNIRKFGPFGRDVGTTFEFTVEDGGQIVGMKGRSDSYLNAIGVHISRAPKGKLVKEHELDGKLRLTSVVPPLSGGPSGVAWDDGMYSGVREIVVASGVHIDSIRVVYDNDGERANANKHGGDDGNNNPKVTLMYPNEFLVSVSGTYLNDLIHSLKFKSNIREFGPFGRDVGTTFEFTVEDGGQIVGMKGRSDSYLNAIGVHISRAPKGKLVKEHELDGKLRLTGVVPPLYRGPSGVAWDDGMYSGVREIIVASGVHIDSIRVVYDNDGERVNANKHGGDDGNNNPKVTLMYPDEFLVSVSGTYLRGLIHSLKFKSNIREFGPFGRDVGTTFEFTVEDGGQIVGMKGRSDSYLNAIGVHISRAPKGKLVKDHELDGKLRLTGVIPPLYGGPSGVAWDHWMYSVVREMIMAYDIYINSIPVVHDNYGERVNANMHGGDDGNNNPEKMDALASDSSSSTVHMNYDVFLNFRGPDTRKIFTVHLYAALQRKGIIPFIDSENLEKGTPIWDVLKAIETSKLSIVIFSKGYAFSPWCLIELAKIMECMDSKKQIVMPVFYEIKPADIRYQMGPFKEAFDKHERDERQSPEIMQKWRSALTKAATLSGWTSDDFKDDLRLVEDIATKILTRLKPSN